VDVVPVHGGWGSQALEAGVESRAQVDIRWNKVTLALSSHAEGGLTERDFQLAAPGSSARPAGGS
jgi:Pterin 4 alpha carbinolamine dehydratase